ncbi:MAG: hypothetical protein IKM64_00245 [Clostridia bacterium]|nr:hypothetical protein [Clostridia bacterium]
MRKYFSTFLMRWKMETQYRGAALGGIICQMVFGLILISVYRALYMGNPQSMPLSAIVTYVWLQQAFFRMLLSSDNDLMDKIRTGGIAYEMCRPVSLYGYYYARIMAMKLMGSLLRAVPMLVLASLLPQGWGIGAPASVPALLLALMGLVLGLLCMCALENITMGITMRTIDFKGFQALLNLLMATFSGNILPLTLFPDAWQRVVRLLPYAQLLDAPIRLYTGETPLHQAGQVFLIQGIWLCIFVGIGLYLWKRNTRKMIVQGG